MMLSEQSLVRPISNLNMFIKMSKKKPTGIEKQKQIGWVLVVGGYVNSFINRVGTAIHMYSL